MTTYKNHNSKNLNSNETKDIIQKKQEDNLNSDTILSFWNKNKEVSSYFSGYESIINLSRETIDKEFRLQSSINNIFRQLFSNILKNYLTDNKETNNERFNEKYYDMIKRQTDNSVYLAKTMSDIIVERTQLFNKVSEFSFNHYIDMFQKYVQYLNNINQNTLSNNFLYPTYQRSDNI